MDISDQLRCLFSAEVETRDDSYVIDVPARELELGELREDETYRVAIFRSSSTDGETADTSGEAGEATTPQPTRDRDPSSPPSPPVDEGEQRTVEIEDTGDQGDGLTRVERGFVVIVPDAEEGERVRIEIADVQENVAFADVVERLSYYD
ncbi:deoxyribonuclease [Halobacteriales archaeon QS_9_67_17]|nr:MAG: deoxyribonuclease [Halobacteriales archaeon QS_9_67_17]